MSDARASEAVRLRATEHPDRVAVIAGDEHVTYAELDARSNRLARHLIGQGASPGSLIGVLLHRSADLVVALLAVHRAGCAYVPLGSSLPTARIEYMLQDSGVQYVLTESDLAVRVAGALAVDVHDPRIEDLECTGPDRPHRADHPAYVIYTSGSTGRPKGVLIEHGPLSRLLAAMRGMLRMTEDDILLAISTVSFDIAAVELFLPLVCGATVALATDDVVGDPRQLAQALDDSRATVMQATPATWRMLVDHGWTGRTGLRMLSGGEALSRNLSDELLRRGTALWNGYGPTEATIYTSVGEVGADGQVVTIGAPLDCVDVVLLDRDGRPVADGASGELHIGGGCLARGYLGREDLTAERFVHPAALDGRWYRTGDQCRRLEDGRLVYEGRLDHQVKVRGFRIELGEIETHLGRCTGVRQAVVTARGEENDRRLVAFVGADPADPPDARELRNTLRLELPAYMVPAAIAVLSELPTTPNGKIDRAALAQIEERPAEPEPVIGTALTTTQEGLLRIWMDVLGREDIGVHDEYFDLGGQSLQAAVIMARIEDVFGVDLPLATIFDASTVRTLAELVEAAGKSEPQRQLSSADRRAGVPLSSAQRRLWYLDTFENIGVAYNEPYATLIRGPLDVERLRGAFVRVLARHEGLRAVVVVRDGVPYQVSPVGGNLPWTFRDLSSESPDLARVQALARAETRRVFDLARGPLIRGSVFRLAPEEHFFQLSLHHIVCDDWTVRLILDQASTAYASSGAPEPTLNGTPAWHYADFADWQSRHVRGALLERQLRYWEERLRGAPTTPTIPTDHPRPDESSHRGGAVPLRFDVTEAEAIDAFSQARRHTAFATVLAAVGAVLLRYSGQSELVVGTPATQRRGSAAQRIAGFMLNTLPIRIDAAGDPTFDELVGRVHREVLGALDHRDAPFEQIVERVNPVRARNHAPLFQVAFTWLEEDQPALSLPGCESRHVPVHTGTAKYDLTIELWRCAGGYTGRIEYASDLFEAATVERMAEQARRYLCRAVAEPDLPSAGVPLLDEEQQHRIVDELNDAARPYPRDATLDALFREQAHRTPQSVALLEGDDVLEYAELDLRADRLASELHRCGLAPGTRVAVDLTRSIDFVVSVLGVLRAGSAYVPLDPSAPSARNRELVDAVACAAVVCPGGVSEAAPLGTPCVDVSVTTDTAANPMSAPAEDGGRRGADEAYVMFTSGSSGVPKAVAIPHRAVVRLVHAQDYLPFDGQQTFLLHSNTGFDASTLELWGPLLHGSRLAIAPGLLSDLVELGALVRRHEVSVLWLTASLFNALVDEIPSALRGVAWVATGGEALSVPHVRRALAALHSTTLVNGYGPTEATTFTCTHRIPRELEPTARSVPIGRPLANTRAYVLDASGHPVPSGVPGELWVGGDAVALGYVNDADLTQDRFRDDPFRSEPEARMYRTGDRCRVRPDGLLEFLGRVDDQVKIRGFRVEPGEVQAVLASHPAVRQCAVVAAEARVEKFLAAYYVGDGDRAVTEELLREHLRSRLPAYMVPTSWTALERMPRTPNGKLDLSALPAAARPAAGTGASAAPGDDVERTILNVWRELLDRSDVGLDDSFFDLGGHSLLAARLVARLGREFGVALPINELFRSPTVRELAGRIRDPGVSATYQAIAIQPDGDRAPLFFLPGLGGSAFVLPDVSRHLGGDQPVYALEARGGDQPMSVEALGAACVECIRSVRPKGPYHLAGFSLGGSLAYEAAQQLVAAKQEVGLLMIIDHAPANLGWNLSSVGNAIANVPFWITELIQRPPPRLGRVVRRKLRALWMNATRKDVSADDIADLTEWSDQMRAAANAQYEAYRAYTPLPYSGRVVLVRARRQPLLDPTGHQHGWGKLAAGGVEECVLPGGHLSILEPPGLDRFGAFMRDVLAAAQSSSAESVR